jgi:hypothetical protein
VPLMWQGCSFPAGGSISMQWSGIEVAGITKIAMTPTTAVTHLMIRVNLHYTPLQI